MYRTYAHCSLTMTRHMTDLSHHRKQNPYFQCSQTAQAFQTHAHNNNKSPIQLQDANDLLEIQCKLNTMLASKFTGIISKYPTDFGRTNLIEMDLPTTGPPISTKPYTIPLTYKSFVDEEIKLLEDTGCISKSLSDWASPICVIKKKLDQSQPSQASTPHVY